MAAEGHVKLAEKHNEHTHDGVHRRASQVAKQLAAIANGGGANLERHLCVGRWVGRVLANNAGSQTTGLLEGTRGGIRPTAGEGPQPSARESRRMHVGRDPGSRA